MRTIEVLGSGCNNCKRLEANAREAVAAVGIEAEIIKVTDYGEIMARGIMSTPGLVIDGRVVSYGRVPSAGDIAQWLTEAPVALVVRIRVPRVDGDPRGRAGLSSRRPALGGGVAQRLEQGSYTAHVGGSNPPSPTTSSKRQDRRGQVPLRGAVSPT